MRGAARTLRVVIELLIAADDRTGALETAGQCADAGCGPVPVIVGDPEVSTGGLVVVDIQSRHLDPRDAAHLATDIERVPAVRVAHKIDSTLRGNWAHELVARQQFGRERVVVVPAFPEVGRTCIGGLVLEHGRPVASGAAAVDARRAIDSSRPAEHLVRAGATGVSELAGATELAVWMVDPAAAPFAVCDAGTVEELEAVGRAWAHEPPVLFAGTSRSIGVAAAALVDNRIDMVVPRAPRPVLVVCGSLNAASRRQVDALVAGGAATVTLGADTGALVDALLQGGIAVLQSALQRSVPLAAADAAKTAAALAATVHRLVEKADVATLLLIGGDTTAAVLGIAPVTVGGTVAPGMPWFHADTEVGPLVITKAGGFGDEQALVRLFAQRVGS